MRVKPLYPRLYIPVKGQVTHKYDQLGKIIDFDTIFAKDLSKSNFFTSAKNF